MYKLLPQALVLDQNSESQAKPKRGLTRPRASTTDQSVAFKRYHPHHQSEEGNQSSESRRHDMWR
jgi:hypothetical protein